MKKLKKFIHSLSIMLAFASVFLFSAIAYADYVLADKYLVVEGTQFNVNCQIPITTEFIGEKPSQESLAASVVKSEYNVNFRLLGIFPVSGANVSVVSPTTVRVLGEPFGIKIYTDGVLVVKTDKVDGENGEVNPAEKAGVKIGDTIKSINGKKVYSNSDVAEIVENSEGKAIKLQIERNGKTKNVNIDPVYSLSGGVYRLGIWVRDSTAGIGTLTFYSPANGIVCGLGHGICDDDTKQLVSVNFGEIVKADIVACRKGYSGDPGELKGRLESGVLGNIISNNNSGIYANALDDFSSGELMSVAVKQDVKNGSAFIYTTVDGCEPDFYSCSIELRRNHSNDSTHNLTVKITDKRLIELTGGIVQGMSGSPIIQNGKLVGAVTHVLVDNPQKGYAIFAENMLKTAQSVAEEQQLKDAS